MQGHPDALDEKLSNTVRQILVSYVGRDLLLSKEDLVRDVSDVLYEEMIFSKVLNKVDNTYLQEIEALQNEERRLLEQREEDLLRLQDERSSRLSLRRPSPRSEEAAAANGVAQLTGLWPSDKKETLGTRSPKANGTVPTDGPRRSGGTLSGRSSISSQGTSVSAFSGLSRAAIKDSSSDDEDLSEFQDADAKADGDADRASTDANGQESDGAVTIDDLPLPTHVPLSAARRRELQEQAIREQAGFLRSIGASENHQFKGHSHGPGHAHGRYDHVLPDLHPVGTTVAPDFDRQHINPEHMAAFDNVIAQYLGISPKASDSKPDASFRQALEHIATGDHSHKLSVDVHSKSDAPSTPRSPAIVATPPSGKSPRGLSVVIPGKGNSSPSGFAVSPSPRSPKVLTPVPLAPEPDIQAARSPRAASPSLPRGFRELPDAK
eukprot:TRINITY_DN4487_c0_g2_i5.p1 TRINITY_DN4487_c0_g2~~TRINITY_DN4487_c0_g2_i5.p1  ORF type:complete len:436 (+),score=143.42 TRINITY_DN4487_c0_g2_i5:218-1525(+)